VRVAAWLRLGWWFLSTLLLRSILGCMIVLRPTIGRASTHQPHNGNGRRTWGSTDPAPTFGGSLQTENNYSAQACGRRARRRRGWRLVAF